jgi:hypothetical protein
MSSYLVDACSAATGKSLYAQLAAVHASAAVTVTRPAAAAMTLPRSCTVIQ